MSAMIDAACPKCRRRFGWSGRVADRPACPRCGHRPPQEELEAADRKMEEFRQLLASRPSATICQRQRVTAGLTLGQASRILGISRRELADYENGRAEIPAEVAKAMEAAYGLQPASQEPCPLARLADDGNPNHDDEEG